MTGSRQQSHSWGTKREALDPLWNEHRNPACHWYIQVNRDQYCNIYICQCMQLLHDGMAETILSTEWSLCGDATYHPLCKFISQVPTRAPTAAVMAGLVLRRFPVLLPWLFSLQTVIPIGCSMPGLGGGSREDCSWCGMELSYASSSMCPGLQHRTVASLSHI